MSADGTLQTARIEGERFVIERVTSTFQRVAKPIDAAPRHTRLLNIRVTQEQRDTVERLAGQKGLSISDWFRAVLIEVATGGHDATTRVATKTPRARSHRKQQLDGALSVVDAKGSAIAADVKESLGCAMSTAWSLLMTLEGMGELECTQEVANPRSGGRVRRYRRPQR